MTMRKIIKDIAKTNKTSEAEVLKEMEAAVRAGMSNPDPEAVKTWAEITDSGRITDIYEILDRIVGRVRKNAEKRRAEG